MGAMVVAVKLYASAALVVFLAVIMAVLATPYSPASTALVPSLVPEVDLAPANAVLAGVDALTLVLGPAAGALLLLLGSPELAFAVNGATFVISAALVGKIRRQRTLRAQRHDRGGVRAGIKAIISSAPVIWTAAGYVVADFTLGQTKVLYLLVSKQLLGTGATGVGWLFSAAGVGGLVASIGASRLAASAKVGRTVVVALLLVGTGTALIALTPMAIVVYALVAVFAASQFVLAMLSVTVLQRTLSPSLAARQPPCTRRPLARSFLVCSLHRSSLR